MGGVAVGVLCAVMALLASGCTALPEAAPVTTAIVDPTLLVVAEEARGEETQRLDLILGYSLRRWL